MLKAFRKGYVIEIDLKEVGYKDYFVDCRYYYDKKKEKFSLSMWLGRRDINSRFKMELQEIDTQYITSGNDRIRDDILRIVQYAGETGFFDKYVDMFEYTCKCFDYGCDYLEQLEEERRKNVTEE